MKKKRTKKKTPGKSPQKCHYCGAPIKGDLIIKIEGCTGEIIFYCSGECCDDDWK
jgi:uncharacterized protein (DUF779 family)